MVSTPNLFTRAPVFDGSSPPYKPDDPTNPLNFYGTAKRDGELAILHANPAAAILRVPLLYGKTEYNAESAVNVLIDLVSDPLKPVLMVPPLLSLFTHSFPYFIYTILKYPHHTHTFYI